MSIGSSDPVLAQDAFGLSLICEIHLLDQLDQFGFGVLLDVIQQGFNSLHTRIKHLQFESEELVSVDFECCCLFAAWNDTACERTERSHIKAVSLREVDGLEGYTLSRWRLSGHDFDDLVMQCLGIAVQLRPDQFHPLYHRLDQLEVHILDVEADAHCRAAWVVYRSLDADSIFEGNRLLAYYWYYLTGNELRHGLIGLSDGFDGGSQHFKLVNSLHNDRLLIIAAA